MEKLMKYFLLFPVIFFSVLIFISCSDLKDNIPAAPDINIHGINVFDVSSSNFHGEKVIASKNKFENCQQCHALDFSGGVTKVSCASSGCHPSIAVHQKGIIDTSSSNFHGVYIANNFSGQMSVCKNCHGDTYQGGLVSPSCENCHSTINIHKDGIVEPQSPNFHGKYISTILGWDMRICGSCHRANYSGGFAAPNCLSCHTGTNGPEACNTCHGDFNDPNKAAPPRAINGSTETIYSGVGAHTSHLYANNISIISCSTCHTVPQSVYAAGHIDTDGKAEIKLGNLAIQGGANPSYDFTSNNCSNTYCHGNFKISKSSSLYSWVYTDSIMTGNNVTVKWNQIDGTQAKCGSCHGLPPTGHLAYPLTECGVACHKGVVDANANIIDKTKHINGVVNLFGN